MTSEAKIGSLLGLIFIFIIAFILKGLPGVHETTNNNALTADMLGSQNGTVGLGVQERKVSLEIINQIQQAEKAAAAPKIPPTQNQQIRFKQALPTSASLVQEIVKAQCTVAGERRSDAAEDKNVGNNSSNRPKERFYTVREGDNLTSIAGKLYATPEGKTTTHIKKIFEANRGRLKSPDELYVGQRLVIPPPSAEHINTNTEPLRPASAERRSEFYTVQENDSLWRIASERLGNGCRYSEIVRLNSDVLDDEDSLKVGMRLKMPVR